MSTGVQETRISPLESSLQAKIDTIRQVLPDRFKSQAERFIKRALITFHTGSDQLKKSTPASFVTSVIKAAEYGLPIDGKLAHAVPYNVKIKDKEGTERWEVQAQFQADYKGLIAVARRLGLIRDAWARIVHANDQFDLYEENSVTRYAWHPNIVDPGKPTLVFAVVTHPEGWYRVDAMNMAEVMSIKARSPAASKGFSPWSSDEGEMIKKTLLRRILKTFTDDPGMIDLLGEGDDLEYPDETTPVKAVSTLQDLTVALEQRQAPRGIEQQTSVPTGIATAHEAPETVPAEARRGNGNSKSKAHAATSAMREPGDESEVDASGLFPKGSPDAVEGGA